MPGLCLPKQNHLLSALPQEEYLRLHFHLKPMLMRSGQILAEAGSRLNDVYFPTTAIISLVYVMQDGASAEIAVIGHEGMIGVPLFMGGDSMPNRVLVQSNGQGYRLPGSILKAEFNRGLVLHDVLLRYTQALLTQMAQTAACNRHHSVEQQLCRWLLLRVDRLSSDELLITQESIAQMLGVRRECITEAAGRLQRADLIHYSRGHIKVIDRSGLEARTCECYGVVREEFERLLP